MYDVEGRTEAEQWDRMEWNGYDFQDCNKSLNKEKR